MSVRARWIALVVVLALLVLGGVAAWFFHTHERVSETVDLPPPAEVRRNPLYALQLALELDGVPVRSRRRLELDTLALGARDTLVLYGDPRVVGADDADALLDWVAGGGHLVVRTPVPSALDGADAPMSPLLGALGLRAHPGEPDCAAWQVRGETSHVEFCRGRRFAFDRVEPARAWGDFRDGFVYARLDVGRGSVDVAAQLDVLSNAQLDEGPHAVLARQWLAPNYRAGTVHLVYDAQVESFWQLLAQRAWMAWLPLLIALAAWLWARTERFGPLLPAPIGERRSLLEHVAASGELLWRYGHGPRLYAAVRDAFLAALRRRDPQAAALTGAPQLALLAERFGEPPAAIADALLTPAPDDARAFRARVALLLRLRRTL